MDLRTDAATGLNDRLLGLVAVGVVIVSGPGDLAFLPVQSLTVMTELQGGLSWLGRQFQLTPVTFTVEPRIITIPTPADPNVPERDREAVWRDPTMAGPRLPFRAGRRHRHLGAPEWWVGGLRTASAPFVAGDVIYFQGTNNKLYRISTNGTGGAHIDDAYISSTPFVANGVVYSQGTNNKLYRINADGTGGTQIGIASTASPPFVVGSVVYYRGTDNRLNQINTDGSGGNNWATTTRNPRRSSSATRSPTSPSTTRCG